MQCCSIEPGFPKNSILILSFVILVITISGCTKSARSMNNVTDSSAAFQALSAKDNLEPLQSKSAKDLVTTGFIYLANQNLKIAELHFVKAINKDPEMVDAFIGLGRTKMLEGNYNEALIGFSKARELKPNSVPALIGEAQAFRSKGKLNAAIERINEAMVIAPEDINVLKELAMIYDLMGKEILSQTLYLEIIEKAPDQAQNHNNMGLNLMVQGKYPEAILSFLQSLELDNDNSRIKNNLASAYLLNGDSGRAINLFKGTVGEAAAYNNIGYLYMTQQQFDEAEQALKKALQINPRYYVRAQENLDKLQEMRHAAHTSHL